MAAAELAIQWADGGDERAILLHTLALKTRQQCLDGAQKDLVRGVFPRVTPRADIETGVAREIFPVHRPMLEIGRMPVEAAGLVVGDLMFPEAQREFRLGFRREREAAVPQHPRPGNSCTISSPPLDGHVQDHVPGKMLAPRQQARLRATSCAGKTRPVPHPPTRA